LQKIRFLDPAAKSVGNARYGLLAQPIVDYYHLYNRGNNYNNIYFGKESYRHFLRLLRKHLVERDISILAYCLMPNHYHLLIASEVDSLPRAMQALSIAYTKSINRRFERVGTLFQGGYRSIRVGNDEYLLNLCRYIHLNPVKAGFVDRPEHWEFSSYLEYAGLRPGTLPQQRMIREMLGSESSYRSFLDEQQIRMDSKLMKLLLDE
jgi:putative transposase